MTQPFCQYDPTGLTNEEYVELFAKFVIKNNAPDIEALLREPDQLRHFGIALE